VLMPDLPMLLNIKQAAEILGESPSTVRRWCIANRMGKRVGPKLFMIRREEITRRLSGAPLRWVRRSKEATG
jgi:hypothetical protein